MITTNNLHLGIEAARTGKTDEARTYLASCLKEDPNNIPALFWMAYVAPSARESLNLLEKILTLDPDNDRVQSGIRWAKKRLEAESPPAPSEPKPASPPAPSEPKPASLSTASVEDAPKPTATQSNESNVEMPDEFIREQLLSKESIQKQAKKGALAHRARRTIDPLLIVIIILGLSVLLLAGILILALTPTETLAAWFPASSQHTALYPETIVLDPALKAVSSQEKVSNQLQQDIFNENNSEADTLLMPIELNLIQTNPTIISLETFNTLIPVTEPESLIGLVREAEQPSTEEITLEPESMRENIAETSYEVPVVENLVISESLSELIEPADVLNGPKLFEPVDEILLPHQPAYLGQKWIEVDVTLQRITAWEGNVPLMSFIGSTGLPGTPTVLGEYNIYWKLESTLMAGADYYLPEVPYTMYFYGGYALHGTYWHDNFGEPMSHGCVNLNNDNAKQLFEWADPIVPEGQTQIVSSYNTPGTLVVVHE